ncbi:hypothetical protein AMTRI_Chr12g271240 [Amborella trichopoda]
MDVAMIVGVNIGDVVVLGVAAEPINPLGFTQEQMATMVDEMGVELNVPLAVVYEAIRQNGLKANNVESVGGKVTSPTWTSKARSRSAATKGKLSGVKGTRSSACIATKFQVSAPFKPFLGEVLLLSDEDDDDFVGVLASLSMVL